MIAVRKTGLWKYRYEVYDGEILVAKGKARSQDRAWLLATLAETRFKIQNLRSELSGRISELENLVENSGSESRSFYPGGRVNSDDFRRGFVGTYNPYIDLNWQHRSV